MSMDDLSPIDKCRCAYRVQFTRYVGLLYQSWASERLGGLLIGVFGLCSSFLISFEASFHHVPLWILLMFIIRNCAYLGMIPVFI
jgi:hypothetical protein